MLMYWRSKTHLIQYVVSLSYPIQVVMSHQRPPGVSIERETVLGTVILIPLLAVDGSVAPNSSLFEVDTEEWRLHSRLVADVNHFDPLYEPFGFYRCMLLLLGFANFVFLMFVLSRFTDIWRHYSSKDDEVSLRALTLRSLLIIPEIVSTVR